MSKVGYSGRDAQLLDQARLTKTNVSSSEGLFRTSYSRDALFSAEASLWRRETGDRGKESAPRVMGCVYACVCVCVCVWGGGGFGGDGKAKERKQCSRIFPLPIVFRALSIFLDAKTPNLGKLLYKKACSLYPESTFDWVNVVILSQQRHPIFRGNTKTKTMLMITEIDCRSDIGTFNFISNTASMN